MYVRMYGYVSLITRTAVTKESKQSGFGSSLTSIRSAMVEWYVRTSIYVSRKIHYIHTYMHIYRSLTVGEPCRQILHGFFSTSPESFQRPTPGMNYIHTYIHTYIHVYIY